MELMRHQEKAAARLGNGKILYGGVGTGKSATVLAYYVEKESPREIVVITTARKRDSLDWEVEAAKFGIGRELSIHGTITVDSWNKIGEYIDRKDCFFIFDEQRLVGHGAWVKSFLKIARGNRWVLLSGTPGDTWMDYAPVFVANGFFNNLTHFKREHVIYEPFVKFPMIKGYFNENKLELMRNHILIEMPFIRHTSRAWNWLENPYDKELVQRVWKDRWHIYEDRPLKDVGEMFRVMRRVVNSDPSRMEMLRKLVMRCHDRVIVFYSFDYELDILRTLEDEIDVYEYNGHVKDPLPTGDRWVYLVQYVAGAEAWNCTTTDAMVLYSATYSYRNFEQAQGRIDRLDTPYSTLYYYLFTSNSPIDRLIKRALSNKKDFNEQKAVHELAEMKEFEDAVWGHFGWDFSEVSQI